MNSLRRVLFLLVAVPLVVGIVNPFTSEIRITSKFQSCYIGLA